MCEFARSQRSSKSGRRSGNASLCVYLFTYANLRIAEEVAQCQEKSQKSAWNICTDKDLRSKNLFFENCAAEERPEGLFGKPERESDERRKRLPRHQDDY
jgi:hypothetical protein